MPVMQAMANMTAFGVATGNADMGALTAAHNRRQARAMWRRAGAIAGSLLLTNASPAAAPQTQIMAAMSLLWRWR